MQEGGKKVMYLIPHGARPKDDGPPEQSGGVGAPEIKSEISEYIDGVTDVGKVRARHMAEIIMEMIRDHRRV